MTTLEIARLRITNQWINGDGFNSVAKVVQHLGAIQAQDFPGALWTIGLRSGKSLPEVEAAIERREIVRTWPMRGTLHFVPAKDVRWMLELTGSRILNSGSLKSRQRNLELDEATFDKASVILESALEGGRQLTRSKSCVLLEKHGIATAGQRGIHILQNLSLKGVLCFGAHVGKEPTFALLREYVPDVKSKPHDEALALLTQRYFTSHGPATIQDFAWWSGLTTADAKAGLAAHYSLFTSENVDGKAYWWLPASSLPLLKASSTLSLLPGFDEFILGYRDRSAALNAEHAQKIVPGNNGMFLATIIWDGQVSGLWKKVIRSKGVKIDPFPFKPMSNAQLLGFHEACRRYSAFLGQAILK